MEHGEPRGELRALVVALRVAPLDVRQQNHALLPRTQRPRAGLVDRVDGRGVRAVLGKVGRVAGDLERRLVRVRVRQRDEPRVVAVP